MKRRKYTNGEQDRLQRIQSENRKLKQQISQLRKQMARIDVDRFQNLKELLDSQDRQEQEEVSREREVKMWSCWECKQGILKLIIMERRDGVFYLRKCDNKLCHKQTKPQKYHDDVKGIKE